MLGWQRSLDHTIEFALSSSEGERRTDKVILEMPMSKDSPIRTMIVGLGRIGWQHHIKAAAESPHFEVTAAVDTLAERRDEAEATYGCATFETLEEGLTSGLAELAVICTRSLDHCEHTVKSLEAGLHAFVEKPAAMSAEEMDRMIAAAQKAGLVVTVNQSARRSPDLRFIREVIDSGALGNVFWIRRSALCFYRRHDWQMSKEYGGGILGNAGVHLIDQILRLADAPVFDVWGDVKHTGASSGDADDFARASIRTTDGRLLEVLTTYTCMFDQPGWLVAGSTGTLTIERPQTDQAKSHAVLKYFDPKKAPQRPVEGPVPVDRLYRHPEELPWITWEGQPVPKRDFPDWYEALYRAIRYGEEPLVTPESARQTLWVIDQVRDKSQWKY